MQVKHFENHEAGIIAIILLLLNARKLGTGFAILQVCTHAVHSAPFFSPLAMSCSMWDISFIVRSQTCGPCIWSMESWTLDCLPCSLLSPPFPLFSISLLPSKQGTQFCVCECLVTQSCPTLCDPIDCSLPGSSVHADSPGKNTGMGFLALLQGDIPNPGIKPRSPALQADSLLTEPTGKPNSSQTKPSSTPASPSACRLTQLMFFTGLSHHPCRSCNILVNVHRNVSVRS